MKRRTIIVTAHVIGFQPITKTASNEREMELRISQSLEHFAKKGIKSSDVEIQRAYL